jgi:hypothetical protein
MPPVQAIEYRVPGASASCLAPLTTLRSVWRFVSREEKRMGIPGTGGRPTPLHVRVSESRISYLAVRRDVLADGRITADESYRLLAAADAMADGTGALTLATEVSCQLLGGSAGVDSPRFNRTISELRARKPSNVIDVDFNEYEPDAA